MSIDAFIDKFNKKYGKILYTVDELPELKFLPSGIFAIDVITGGGLPWGRVSEIWGKRSASKSTVALKWVAMAQRTCAFCYEHLALCKCKKSKPIKCFYVDAEGSFTYSYAEKLGVTKDIIVARPDFLEQCWDACELAIRDEDIQFVVVDTIASLASKKEIEDSTADKHMAEGARAINQGLRKVLSAMNNALNDRRLVSVVLINQVRENLQITWGNRDFKPGGLGQDFITSIELKLSLKEKVYKGSKENEIMVGQIVHAVCMKNKCAKPMLEGEFYLDLHDKLGDTKEYDVVKQHLERYQIDFKGDLSKEHDFFVARKLLLSKIQGINVMLKDKD